MIRAPSPDPAGFQADFAAALRPATLVRVPNGLSKEAAGRFRVYRNNVHAGLAGTLADAYPVVRRLVGDAFFWALAAEYVPAHLPRDRRLTHYGEAFPAFLARFEPARAVPYLADVARLERARLEATHAPDAAPLDPALLGRCADRLPLMRLIPHPALRLVHAAHPVLEIWLANQPETPAASLELKRGAQTVVVSRPYLDVGLSVFIGAEAVFVTHLAVGEPIGAAAALAAAAQNSVDIQSAFHALLVAGAFCGVDAAVDPASSEIIPCR